MKCQCFKYTSFRFTIIKAKDIFHANVNPMLVANIDIIKAKCKHVNGNSNILPMLIYDGVIFLQYCLASRAELEV